MPSWLLLLNTPAGCYSQHTARTYRLLFRSAPTDLAHPPLGRALHVAVCAGLVAVQPDVQLQRLGGRPLERTDTSVLASVGCSKMNSRITTCFRVRALWVCMSRHASPIGRTFSKSA